MKAAVVTGSTSGIGLAIATLLVQEGWCVTVNGFEEKKAVQSSLDSLDQKGKDRVFYHQADLSDPQQARSLVEKSMERWKRLDLVVNNAGIQHVAPLEDFPLEKWHQILNLNLSACFYIAQAALPLMKSQKYGRFVNIASVHGLVASKHKSAYVAAKHGLIGLSKVLALETAGTGVTCNAICPGWVLTPLVEKQIQDKAAKEHLSFEQAKECLLGEKQPSQSFVRPEDIGTMVAFLASPAADQMTGSVITMDGGWTAQ